MYYSPTETSSRDLVVSLYRAVEGGDLDTASAALAEDVVLHVPGTHPLAGDHRGPAGVLELVAGIRALTDDGEHIEVLDVLEGDRFVAVCAVVTARRSGRTPLTNRTVHVLRIHEGRVAEIWFHNFDDLTVDAFWS